MRIARIRAYVAQGERSYWITLSTRIVAWDLGRYGSKEAPGDRLLSIVTRSSREGERLLDQWERIPASGDVRKIASHMIYQMYGTGWGLEWWVGSSWEPQ